MFNREGTNGGFFSNFSPFSNICILRSFIRYAALIIVSTYHTAKNTPTNRYATRFASREQRDLHASRQLQYGLITELSPRA